MSNLANLQQYKCDYCGDMSIFKDQCSSCHAEEGLAMRIVDVQNEISENESQIEKLTKIQATLKQQLKRLLK